ncbi:carbon starvation CstA family protein [Thiovibrio sp. JS02]
MNSLLLATGCLVAYLAAYHTYGRYLARKIFRLDDGRQTPAHRLRDGVDFIPTGKDVLFGHHFTSIAGTGPIVGPAIGVIWGWLPALLWVLFGPIVIGAVHDLGSLVVSIRHEGKSIAEVIGKTISPRVRHLFFAVIFLELWIVIAIFALIIALLFTMYPKSVLAIWLEVPIALLVGVLVRRKGNLLLPLSIAGVILMYLTVWLGSHLPLTMPSLLGMNPVLIWMLILFAYAAAASVLPVDLLLQPRDYLNSHQLLIAMGLLALGLLVAQPPMAAPAYVPSPAGAPSLWPFLFVIIACGAVSGFHSVVSSGTSSKQLNRESDAQFVGYGSMLVEGGLAVLVIIACTAGLGMGVLENGVLLTGPAAYENHYASWASAQGLGANLAAFIEGAANMISALGLPRALAVTTMGVFIVSFAATTLDSAARIQRYVVSELAEAGNLPALGGRWPATAIAIGSAMALAFYSGDGQGAMALWPIFGAINQLLAGLALLAITAYLAHGRRPLWFTFPPLAFMVTVTSWAMLGNIGDLLAKESLFLAALSAAILCLQAMVLGESLLVMWKRRPRTQPLVAASEGKEMPPAPLREE